MKFRFLLRGKWFALESEHGRIILHFLIKKSSPIFFEEDFVF